MMRRRPLEYIPGRTIATIDYIPGRTTATIVRRPRGRPPLPRPACARNGCENEVKSRNARYCSIECRNIDMAPVYQAKARERAERRAADDQHSLELREGFRLQTARVPAVEWPEAARRAYNEYARKRRAAQREQQPPRPGVSPALQEAFRNLGLHKRGDEWSQEARDAYNAYQRERRQARLYG